MDEGLELINEIINELADETAHLKLSICEFFINSRFPSDLDFKTIRALSRKMDLMESNLVLALSIKKRLEDGVSKHVSTSAN